MCRHSALSTQLVNSKRGFTKPTFFAFQLSLAITFAASAQNYPSPQKEYEVVNCNIGTEVFRDLGSACKRVRDYVKSQLNGSPPHYQKAIDPISKPSEDEGPATFSCYWSVTDYFGNVLYERAQCGGLVRPIQSLLLNLTPAPNQKDPRPLKAEGVDGKSTLDWIAKVTGNGSPKAGVEVLFQVDVVSMTGGHEHHDSARPKGSLSKVNGTTDANGEVQLTFKASEIAGIHTIKATCATCSNSPVTKEIQVKVPGLIELGADTAKPPEYALVGAILGKHTSNHWFTPNAVRQLDKAIGLMYETGWGQVGVNDGSLIWGGLFDVKAPWSTPHTGHRLGTEVDISFNNPRVITEVQKKKTYSALCKKDNATLGVQTLWHDDDAYPDHFHIYLTGQGLTSKSGGGPCCMSYAKLEPVLNKDKTPVIKDGKPAMKRVSYCEETSPR